MYSRATGPRAAASASATTIATPAPISTPCQPSRRASARSRAPMRCDTSVIDACASDNGSMNRIAARLAAIWCPATGSTPRRAMKTAIRLKPLTSIRIVAPIGSPSRSCVASARRPATASIGRSLR